jgi:4-amino-4-deoxy-L-arabinose transferase-like glycosyltransferase
MRFIYSNDADRMLFWARLPMILLATVGAIVTFLWARELFGAAAGVVAAGLYCFSPNLLAHGMLVTTDVPLAAFTVLALYLFWKRRDVPAGLALGAAMATKFSGAFLPLLVAALCIAHDHRSALRRLLIMGCACLMMIEISYLFAESPLTYFRNAMFVNANHLQGYPFYLLGRMKSHGFWYYFLVALGVKATIPTLLFTLLAAIHITAGWMNRGGEVILLAGIGFYATLISIAADQLGIRYLLPIFPLIFIWTSRVVPFLASRTAGAAVIAVLMLWQAQASIRAFPNYIPYFNELAGGSANGASWLDDSNIDWGQGWKQAAEYVRSHHLENVRACPFSPLERPDYYGLPPSVSWPDAVHHLAATPPAPGVYIISAHRVVRMRAMNAEWNRYKPVDRIGESLWVYVF